jgi:3-deoxy-D-manno-octulosonic acid kinase
MNSTAAAGVEALVPIAGGAMLYDASRVGQPGRGLFTPAYWRERGALEEMPGGRGTVSFVSVHEGERWVLRHYRRGGLVARVVDDAYLYTGAERTRSFREWRLLRQLRDWHLPVPVPIAAAYRRLGLFYRADLITAELPTRRTLAMALRGEPLAGETWQAVGRCIARFHAHGVQHADLNAHNLLLDEAGAVYLIDFDRGRIRRRGDWESAVLARLQRSLLKVTAGLPADRYGDAQWHALQSAAGVTA